MEDSSLGHSRFRTDEFLAYLDDLHRHFGKCVIIMDKASVHTAGGVKEFEESNDVHIITFLPEHQS